MGILQQKSVPGSLVDLQIILFNKGKYYYYGGPYKLGPAVDTKTYMFRYLHSHCCYQQHLVLFTMPPRNNIVIVLTSTLKSSNESVLTPLTCWSPRKIQKPMKNTNWLAYWNYYLTILFITDGRGYHIPKIYKRTILTDTGIAIQISRVQIHTATAL